MAEEQERFERIRRKAFGPRLAASLWLGTIVCVGCASRPSPYQEALSQARASERAGDVEAASASYRQAANRAKSEEDRVEALYLEAQAFRREHDYPAAIARLETLVEQHPASDRAPRAVLDQARLWEKLGAPEKARRTYLRLLTAYPGSAAAESGATAYVRLCPGPASQVYQTLLEGQPEGRLAERLRLRLGQSLAEEGKIPQAIEVLESLARDAPLPGSSLADEALLLSAKLRRAEGDFLGSLEVLRVLRAQDTSSDIVGSYVRSAFIEALWLEAEILRDDLRREEQAERAFVDLSQTYPDSRLVDDALWQAAFLARFRGDEQTACRLAHRLIERTPQSRFAECVGLVCASAKAPSGEPTCERALESIPERIRNR